jgi:hypothetical protein
MEGVPTVPERNPSPRNDGKGALPPRIGSDVPSEYQMDGTKRSGKSDRRENSAKSHRMDLALHRNNRGREMNTVTQKAEWRFPIENSFVRDTSLSVEARLLYIIIKGYVGPECEMPFPSLNTLARHMDRHRESVQKHLKELEHSGYIEKIKTRRGGMFSSTRYVLFDRSGKKPLRFPPATVKAATKRYQLKDVPSDAKECLKKSKESPEVSGVEFLEEIPAESKPDMRAKEEKLKTVKVPWQYPSEREFNEFVVSENLDNVANRNGNLYATLCARKWHDWRDRDAKWVRISDWRSYVTGLEETMEAARTRTRR